MGHAALEAIAISTADDLLLWFLNKQYCSDYLKLGADSTYLRCCVIRPSTWPLLVDAPSEESGPSCAQAHSGLEVLRRHCFLLVRAQRRRQSCAVQCHFLTRPDTFSC